MVTTTMRIAHVTAVFPPYWNGISHVAYQHARLLHERGHEVTVITPQEPEPGPTTFPFAVEQVPAMFWLGNAPFTPTLGRRLARFDVVHLHYPYIFGAEVVAAAARMARVPMVLTYHNRLESQGGIKRMLFSTYNVLIEPLVLAAAQRIVAVRLAHFMAKFPDYQSTRLREIPNGVDTPHFTPGDGASARAAMGIPSDSPVALFVGALDEAHRYKNVDGQLEAFAAIDMPAARYLIVGDGDRRAALEARAAVLGTSDRVRFLGKLPPTELPRIYAAADVLLLPSTHVESFGMPIIEALACGTPAIASDLPGVRDAIAHGEDGFVIPPGDVGALREKLEWVFANRDQAKMMGSRGRDRVVSTYDWHSIADQLETLYAELLQGRRLR